MKLLPKLLIIVIIVLLISVSAYIVFFTGGSNNGQDGDHDQNENDTEPPTITFVTGDKTAIAGETIIISALFSDNVGVTEANLFYRAASASMWDAVSILPGTASVSIPLSATENYYYYVTVNDAAGNGPVGDPSVDGSNYFIITVIPSGDEGNNTERPFTHQVLIEESTSETCHYCPNVGAILEDLESDPIYENMFYYVSMVTENNKASDYLTASYNWSNPNQDGSNPTVYVDAGYKVILGGLNADTVYTNAILAAKDRSDVPEIRVTVTAEYQNTTNTVLTNALIENNESSVYSGRLRVYLLEIISTKYNDYSGLKYRNSFVDFIINEDVTVLGKGSKTVTANWSVGSYDYENLKIIAAVFSPTGHPAYSFPPDSLPFTAHYADAVNATYVAIGERNLPPEVGITSPQNGKVYLRGNLLFSRLYNKTSLLKYTWLIGKTTIKAYATDDTGISKVEFYLGDTLVSTVTSPPYDWTTSTKLLKKPLIPHKYTITVKAYDTTNKTTSASITVRAWWVF